MLTACALPRGVALVRLVEGTRRVVLVSERLSPAQQFAACVFASVLAQYGDPYISISVEELLGAIHDAAA